MVCTKMKEHVLSPINKVESLLVLPIFATDIVMICLITKYVIHQVSNSHLRQKISSYYPNMTATTPEFGSATNVVQVATI